MRPVTATMMVAASTAWGSAWNQPVKKATTSAISAAEMTPASGVLAPGGKIDDRAGKPTGDREAARHGAGQVGRAQAQQLAVGFNALLPLERQRLGHRHALDKAHQ